MEPGQRLRGSRDDQSLKVLGLGGGLHRSLDHCLDRVRVLGPGCRAPHQVADHGKVHLGPVQGRARPGAPDPRLGRRCRDPTPQGLVPAQLRAGRPRRVSGFGDAGQG